MFGMLLPVSVCLIVTFPYITFRTSSAKYLNISYLIGARSINICMGFVCVGGEGFFVCLFVCLFSGDCCGKSR